MTSKQRAAIDHLRASLNRSRGLRPVILAYDAALAIMEALVAQAASPAIGPSAGSEPSGQRIYVASRASLPARPAMWRQFRADGWPIISTWIDEAEAGQTDDLGELWRRIEREVTTATALIFYAEPDDIPLKGAYIEVGMALAAGVPVLVVTPGLNLTAPSYRPIGSWVCHPAVSFHRSPDAALRAAAQPLPEAPK